MIFYITPSERLTHYYRIHEFFGLRKKIFCDTLKWSTAKPYGLEYDQHDDCFNVYILFVDQETDSVQAGVRLIPTKGAPEYQRKWMNHLKEPSSLVRNDIWEASKFCASPPVLGQPGGLLANKAALAVIAAASEFCRVNSISQILGVCDRNFLAMARVCDSAPTIIASRVNRRGNELFCCLWQTPIMSAKLASLRQTSGCGTEPIRCKVA